MRISPGLLLRRARVGVFALAAIWTPGGTATAEPPAGHEPGTESQRLAFAQRYRALQHGGIVRAANTSISCRATFGTCAGVRRGENLKPGTGAAKAPVNGDFEMFVAGRTTALDDVLNSTIGPAVSERVPAYANTLGYHSDVFDLGTALRRGGDQLAFRLVSQRDAAWAGALFVAVDARQ